MQKNEEFQNLQFLKRQQLTDVEIDSSKYTTQTSGKIFTFGNKDIDYLQEYNKITQGNRNIEREFQKEKILNEYNLNELTQQIQEDELEGGRVGLREVKQTDQQEQQLIREQEEEKEKENKLKQFEQLQFKIPYSPPPVIHPPVAMSQDLIQQQKEVQANLQTQKKQRQTQSQQSTQLQQQQQQNLQKNQNRQQQYYQPIRSISPTIINNNNNKTQQRSFSSMSFLAHAIAPPVLYSSQQLQSSSSQQIINNERNEKDKNKEREKQKMKERLLGIESDIDVKLYSVQDLQQKYQEQINNEQQREQQRINKYQQFNQTHLPSLRQSSPASLLAQTSSSTTKQQSQSLSSSQSLKGNNEDYNKDFCYIDGKKVEKIEQIEENGNELKQDNTKINENVNDLTFESANNEQKQLINESVEETKIINDINETEQQSSIKQQANKLNNKQNQQQMNEYRSEEVQLISKYGDLEATTYNERKRKFMKQHPEKNKNSKLTDKEMRFIQSLSRKDKKRDKRGNDEYILQQQTQLQIMNTQPLAQTDNITNDEDNQQQTLQSSYIPPITPPPKFSLFQLLQNSGKKNALTLSLTHSTQNNMNMNTLNTKYSPNRQTILKLQQQQQDDQLINDFKLEQQFQQQVQQIQLLLDQMNIMSSSELYLKIKAILKKMEQQQIQQQQQQQQSPTRNNQSDNYQQQEQNKDSINNQQQIQSSPSANKLNKTKQPWFKRNRPDFAGNYKQEKQQIMNETMIKKNEIRQINQEQDEKLRQILKNIEGEEFFNTIIKILNENKSTHFQVLQKEDQIAREMMNKDSQQIRQQLFEEKKQKERAEKSDKEAQEAALDRKKMKQGFKAQMLLRGEERRRQFDQQKDEEKGIKINKEQQSLFSVMTEHIDGQNKDKDANKQGAGIEQDEDQLNQSNDPRYFGMSEELKNMLFKSVAPRPPTRDMGTEAKIELQNRKGYTDQSSIWDPDSVFQGNQSVEQVKTQEITPRQKTPNKNKIDSGLDRWFNATLGIGPVSDEMVLKSEIAAAHESVSAQKLLQITNKNISNQTKEPTQQISRSISPQFRQINHQAFPYPLSYKSKDPTQSTTQAIIQSEQYKKQIIQEKIKKDQLEKQQKFGKYKRQTQSNDQEASGIIAIWNKQGKENEQQTSDKDLSIPEIIKLSQKQLNESPKKETARKGGINIIKNSYDHPLNVLMAVEAERWKNSSAADFLSTNPLLLSNGTVPAASQSQQKERQRGRSPSPSSKIHSILANQGFDEQKRLWEQSEAKNKQQIQTNSIQQQPQIEQEQEQDNFEPIDIEQNEDAFNINNASTQIGQRRNQVRQSIYQQKIVTHNITQEEREGGREQVISALSKYMEERRMNDSNPLKLRQYEQDQMYKTYDITSMPGQLKKSLVQIPRVISNKLNHQNVKPPSGKQSLTNTLSSNIQQLNGGRIPLSGTLSSNAKSSQSRLLKLSNSQSTSNFIGIEPQITSKRPTSSK